MAHSSWRTTSSSRCRGTRWRRCSIRPARGTRLPAGSWRTSRTPLALGNIGAFGGMVRVPPGMRKPVLVLSTDGVGTKVLVAIRAGVHDTIGEDLVNHSVNDILVHGAAPLAFQDYFATGTLVPEVTAAIVTGVARGCRAHGMVLAGGETAQMPVIPRLHALAHITGGGIPGNLIRVLPDGCEAVVDAGGWPWPPVFRALMREGRVALAEMRRVFNLGVGMIAVAARNDVEPIMAAARRAGIATWIIGEVSAGPTGVRFAER